MAEIDHSDFFPEVMIWMGSYSSVTSVTSVTTMIVSGVGSTTTMVTVSIFRVEKTSPSMSKDSSFRV